MKKSNWIAIFLLWVLFLIYLFVQKPDFFRFNFNPQQMLKDYLRSQDIYDPQDTIKDRIFISDSEIYLAAGYLYSLGKNPSDYNFPHPPLLKYLYGFSLRVFGNPYWLQAVFGFLLFALTYLLGIKISRNHKISVLALLFLIFDPLTADAIFNVYLDLGQTVLGLAFVLAFIFYPYAWLVQGILLGLLLAAKFWSTSIFLLVLLVIYRKFFLKNFKIRMFIKMSVVSVLVYLSTYIIFFQQGGNLINFLWLQLRMVKLMLEHNSVSFWGGQLWLFLS